jgi:ABC-type lipoprotein release transport system permease subunit
MPELDRNSVFAPIATIGEAFALPGRAHEIAVMIDDLRRLDRVKASLSAAVAGDGMADAVVLGWDEVLPGIKQGIDMDWDTGQLMYVVLMMVVGFGIMNTFLMSFLERVREFGVLMAVGMKPSRISRLIGLEAMLLTAVGLAAGLVVGAAVTLYFQRVGIYFASMDELMREMGMDPVMHPELSLRMAVRTSLFVVIVSALVALYPAFKVMRLRPVDAMRAT